MEKLSLVLPVYNEAESLSKCIEGLVDQLKDIEYELIIIEDGCTDNTPKEAARLEQRHNQVNHLHFDKRLGKGKAIEKGLDDVEGDILGFIDTDLSIKPEDVLKSYKSIQETGNDMVIGSRYVETSESKRSKKRLYSSKIYNFLVRKTLRTGVKDHQCGLKLFRRSLWEEISDEISDDKWFWDTSLIHQAKKSGHSIDEIGIKWSEKGNSDVNVVKDGIKMLEKLAEVKIEEKNLPLDIRYGRFMIIGGIGALLNTAILFILTDYLELHYILSSVFAIESAIILMFFLNNRFTFDNKKEQASKIVLGIFKSNIVRSVGIMANLGLLYVFTEFFNIYFLVSNLFAIIIASIINFTGEKHFNWEN